MRKKPQMEREPFLQVVAMTPERAREFFGLPPDTLVEDAGPPSRPEQYKPGARLFLVWPKGPR